MRSRGAGAPCHRLELNFSGGAKDSGNDNQVQDHVHGSACVQASVARGRKGFFQDPRRKKVAQQASAALFRCGVPDLAIEQ